MADRADTGAEGPTHRGAEDPGAGTKGGGLTYEEAGVSLAAAEEALARIAPAVRSTYRSEVMGDIGGFGAFFAFPPGFSDPVLVAGTDGVGTKAVVAREVGRLGTIGIDLVAMCVDDLACQGAEPLFFLDYVAMGRLDPGRVGQLVEGVAEGCRRAGCALVGGEMAEHPGAMAADDFELVGFAVGVVERSRLVTGERVEPGDVLVGLPSPGLRCNGYSLARRALLERGRRSLADRAYPGADHSLADELLRPSVIYAPAVRELTRVADVRGLAHVTGGGIPANLARVLPAGCDAVVRRRCWATPPIFAEIQQAGGVADDEMARVFNLGLGMIAVVAPGEIAKALEVLRQQGHEAVEVGVVLPGSGRVRLEV